MVCLHVFVLVGHTTINRIIWTTKHGKLCPDSRYLDSYNIFILYSFYFSGINLEYKIPDCKFSPQLSFGVHLNQYRKKNHYVANVPRFKHIVPKAEG